MINELLPIGSIVLLKGGIRKLMITGIKTVVKEEPDTIYDYIGVLYPEGFIGDEGNFLFNNEDINDVIFKGYTNPEREYFMAFLDQKLSEIENEE